MNEVDREVLREMVYSAIREWLLIYAKTSQDTTIDDDAKQDHLQETLISTIDEVIAYAELFMGPIPEEDTIPEPTSREIH